MIQNNIGKSEVKKEHKVLWQHTVNANNSIDDLEFQNTEQKV